MIERDHSSERKILRKKRFYHSFIDDILEIIKSMNNLNDLFEYFSSRKIKDSKKHLNILNIII